MKPYEKLVDSIPVSSLESVHCSLVTSILLSRGRHRQPAMLLDEIEVEHIKTFRRHLTLLRTRRIPPSTSF